MMAGCSCQPLVSYCSFPIFIVNRVESIKIPFDGEMSYIVVVNQVPLQPKVRQFWSKETNTL